MAEVTGMTAEKIDALMGDMIVNAKVDPSTGAMIFVTKSGKEINSGSAISPSLAVEKAYPIGSIYIGTSNKNPKDLLGVGEWTRFANGRTLVGVNEDEAEFDSVVKTGGAKTHKLSINEMPSHTHTQRPHDHGTNTSGEAGPTLSGTGRNYRISGSNSLDTSSTTATNDSTGGSQPHNNLQPYITVYMWRRTA